MPNVVSRKGHAREKESLGIAAAQANKHLFPKQPWRLAAFFTIVMRFGVSLHRDCVQADILDRGPGNRQATALRREHINLIGALAHEAPQTLKRMSVGAAQRREYLWRVGA